MNRLVPVDCLLLRVSARDLVRTLGEDWSGELRAAYPEVLSHRYAHRPEQDLLYGYLRLPERVELGDAAWREWSVRLTAFGLATAELHRLEIKIEQAGASSTATPLFHYVVETDADDEGWMREIERWYADEHLPGLASVPGCIRAQRWTNHDGGPRSLACYDLAREDVLGSPPWLKVRATPWSDRTRPHFRNTRRTMFRPLEPGG